MPVAHTEFDADGVRGSTISLRSGAFRMVTVRIEAEGTVVSTIAFPKNHVQLTDVRTLEGSSADIENNEIGVSVTSAGNTMIE